MPAEIAQKTNRGGKQKPRAGSGAVNGFFAGSANRIRAGNALQLARIAVTFHDYPPTHYATLRCGR